MDFELSETQKLIRDTARNFAREKVAPGAKRRDQSRKIEPAGDEGLVPS